MEKKVYTMDEVRQMLAISKTKVYEWARKGVFPVIKIGRKYFSPITAFDRWLDSAGQEA